MEEPVVEEPVSEEPVLEEPAIEGGIVEEHVIEEPVMEEPVIEKPAIEEAIVIEETVMEEPVIEPVGDNAAATTAQARRETVLLTYSQRSVTPSRKRKAASIPKTIKPKDFGGAVVDYMERKMPGKSNQALKAWWQKSDVAVLYALNIREEPPQKCRRHE